MSIADLFQPLWNFLLGPVMPFVAVTALLVGVNTSRRGREVIARSRQMKQKLKMLTGSLFRGVKMIQSEVFPAMAKSEDVNYDYTPALGLLANRSGQVSDANRKRFDEITSIPYGRESMKRHLGNKYGMSPSLLGAKKTRELAVLNGLAADSGSRFRSGHNTRVGLRMP